MWFFLFSLSPCTGEMVALCLILDKSVILKQYTAPGKETPSLTVQHSEYTGCEIIMCSAA